MKLLRHNARQAGELFIVDYFKSIMTAVYEFNLAGSKIPSVKSIDEILHNVSDHTETLLRVFRQPVGNDEFTQRLIKHIALEEEENSKALEVLHAASPSLLTQKLMDHSFFLKTMVLDQSIPLDLKQELLHHFGEEHAEWQAENQGNSAIGEANEDHPAGISGAGYRGKSEVTSQEAKVSMSVSGEADAPPASERSWTVGPMWPQGGL